MGNIKIKANSAEEAHASVIEHLLSSAEEVVKRFGENSGIGVLAFLEKTNNDYTFNLSVINIVEKLNKHKQLCWLAIAKTVEYNRDKVESVYVMSSAMMTIINVNNPEDKRKKDILFIYSSIKGGRDGMKVMEFDGEKLILPTDEEIKDMEKDAVEGSASFGGELLVIGKALNPKNTPKTSSKEEDDFNVNKK